MSDAKKTSHDHRAHDRGAHDPGAHRAPADGASPLHLWSQLYKTEMKRFLDEAAPAVDRSVDAWGRMLAESTMAAQVGLRAWHDATRSFFEAARKNLD